MVTRYDYDALVSLWDVGASSYAEIPAGGHEWLLAGVEHMLQRHNWHDMDDADWDDVEQKLSDLFYAVLNQVEVGTLDRIGEVIVIAGTFEPDYALRLDGSSHAVSKYPILATRQSAWVSGDYIVLPNAQNRFLRVDANQIGGTGGADTHVLTLAQIPAHGHNIGLHSSSVGSGNYIGKVSRMTSKIASINSANAGSGQAHNNMPAYMNFDLWVVCDA